MIAMEEMKLFDKGEVTVDPLGLFNNVVVAVHILRFSFPGFCQAGGVVFYN
jgi:hypothetical protein